LVSDTCQERASADGTECGAGGTDICVATACVTRGCGDGFLEAGPTPAREGCDDANMAAGDLCSAACVATALRLTPDRGSLRAQIPTVGVDGAGRHLIVWIPDPNAPVMLARRFDAAGAPLESTAFGIPSSAYPSEIAVTGLSGGGWVVTYVQLGMNSNTVVLFRMVASDGTVGSEQVVSSRRGQNREPVITSVGTGFVIVWWVYNTWDGIDSGLVARRYSATGTALSSEFFVAVQRADYQELARVTSQGNTWLVVWQGNPGSGFQPQIRGRFFSLSNPTSGELVFANGTSPTVASLGGGEFAVGYGSWNTPYGVFVRRVPQASPLSQTANMVGWSHSSSPEIMVAPYGSSILVAWRNANIDVSLAAIGPTALNAVDALSANAELATANAWFTLSPSPRGTWFVTSHPGTRDDWLAVTLLRHP
jgi:cysteine-rich repeat protein